MPDGNAMRIGIDARWMSRRVVNTQFALLGTLLQQNAKCPYEATFVLYTDELAGDLAIRQPDNVVIRRLKVPRLRSGADHTSLLEDMWWFERSIPPALQLDGVTVFVSPYYRAPRVGVPVINMVHDLSFLLLNESLLPAHLRSRFKRSALRRLLEFYCRRVATHTIAVSEYSRRCVIDRLGLRPERVSVCYNGVDTDLLASAREEADGEEARPAPGYLLYVGYNSLNKNVSGLVRAYALLPQAFREANHLLLRTTPGEEQALIQERGLSSTVRYQSEHLSRPQLAALIARARALILVSHDEGFGLPVVEALAAGVPVVISGGGALAEVTRGEMTEVDPRDARSIAGGILSVIERGLTKELRLCCREIAAHYSLQRAANALMQVIAQRSVPL